VVPLPVPLQAMEDMVLHHQVSPAAMVPLREANPEAMVLLWVACLWHITEIQKEWATRPPNHQELLHFPSIQLHLPRRI